MPATDLPQLHVPGHPGLNWQKSSRSHLDDKVTCVALARTEDGRIAVTDTKNPDTALIFDSAEIQALLDGVRAGDFDHLVA